jgi:GNAT superfamily N-acetyltransferase
MEKTATPNCLVSVNPRTAAENMYVSAIDFDKKNALKVAKFSSTADSRKAILFHKLTAESIVQQLKSPSFGIQAKVVLAAPDFDYSQYNDREADLANLEWETTASGAWIVIKAKSTNPNEPRLPSRHVAEIICTSKEPYFKVSSINMTRGFRGTGLGQLLYDKAIAYAKSHGFQFFCSDELTGMTKDGRKAWERLSKRYPVKFDEKGNRFTIDLNPQVGKTAASDYNVMFKAILTLVPKAESEVKREIDWAVKHLKKKDRIILFLRWFQTALAKELMDQASNDEVNSRINSGLPFQAPTNGVETTSPPDAPPTLYQQMEKLFNKYQRIGGVVTMEEIPVIEEELKHFLGYPLPTIQNTSFTNQSPAELLAIFREAEEKWQQGNPQFLQPHPEDRIILQFPNGWAWWWVDRSFCTEEKEAMGHCGNEAAGPNRPWERLLSLRRPEKRGNKTYWYSHVTFILDTRNMQLGEMKGRQNNKPQPEYHPYIVALLKDPKIGITGIVGGGYLPENNFALSDLTTEQQKEVAEANPSIGLSIRAYYDIYGFDEKLEQRVSGLLEPPASTHYEPNYGYVVRSWKSADKFIADCGDKETVKAWKFIQNGEFDYASPDAGNFLEMFKDLPRSRQTYHIGLALQYNYPRNIKDWFRDRQGEVNFDPANPAMVKKAIELVFDAYVTPKVPKSFGQEGKVPSTVYQVPVIKEFYEAYTSAGPDAESIKETLREQEDKAFEETNTTQEYGHSGKEKGVVIMQVMQPERIVELATEAENKHYRRHSESWDKPKITMPYEWDEWKKEKAVEYLGRLFEAESVRPKDKRQKRLFPEPRTQEQAIRKGITVSRLLKNSLFASTRSYYHITGVVNRKSIKERGLDADFEQGDDWVPHPKGVYLFKTEQAALNFAYDFWGYFGSGGRGLDLWRVRAESTQLQVDDHPECSGCLYSPVSIPPNKLKLVSYLTENGEQRDPTDEDGHLEEDDIEYLDENDV